MKFLLVFIVVLACCSYKQSILVSSKPHITLKPHNLENDNQKVVNTMEMPFSWEPLRKYMNFITQKSGIQLLVINNKDAKNSNACFAVPAGSYHESLLTEPSISQGTAH